MIGFKEYYTEGNMGKINFPSSILSKINKFVLDYLDALFSNQLIPLEKTDIGGSDDLDNFNKLKKIKDKRHCLLNIQLSEFGKMSKLFSVDSTEILIRFKYSKLQQTTLPGHILILKDKSIITILVNESYFKKNENKRKVIHANIIDDILHELTHYIQYITPSLNFKNDLGVYDDNEDNYYSNKAEIPAFYNIIANFITYMKNMLPQRAHWIELDSKEGSAYLTKMINSFLREQSTLLHVKKVGKIEEYNKGLKLFYKDLETYIKDHRVKKLKDFFLR